MIHKTVSLSAVKTSCFCPVWLLGDPVLGSDKIFKDINFVSWLEA